MGNGAQPVPEALVRRGPQYHATALTGDIDLSACAIAEIESQQGAIGVVLTAHRPLIARNGLHGGGLDGSDGQAPRSGNGGPARMCRIHRDIRRPDVEARQGFGRSWQRDPQGQHPGDGFKFSALDRLIGCEGRTGVTTAGAPEDGLENAGAFRPMQRRIGHVQHDDAGGKPHQDQGTNGNAQVSVQQDQDAPSHGYPRQEPG